MKSTKHLKILACVFLACSIASCGGKNNSSARKTTPPVEPPAAQQQYEGPPQLPLRYQTPSYVASQASSSELGDIKEGYQMKVGATIRSTTGPQPLWDVMKRLANLKGMTVSWASDVNQNYKVDVDIAANDYFFESIEHLLRQADYFHEVQGKTIIVKYKDTKVFQIGLPHMKSGYVTTVGGNYLAARSGSTSSAGTGTEGTVKVISDKNVFDVWENITNNMEMIMNSYTYEKQQKKDYQDDLGEDLGDVTTTNVVSRSTTAPPRKVANTNVDMQEKSNMGKSYYTIDKNVGLISVTAPKPLLSQVESYIETVKKELFRQVALEAKIIEVYLDNHSQLGLDWSALLGGLPVAVQSLVSPGNAYPGGGKLINSITMAPATFNVLINALEDQGETHVLSNPKLTVLNGQPAMISVGRDHAYIKSVEKDEDKDNDEVTYTAEIDHVMEGVALGVVPSIVEGKKVILHLTPITTELVGGSIPQETFGEEGLIVGLPVVSIRQMSTTVEVNNGEMLVIGGLIDSIEKNEDSFAPVLGNIPILKYLFGVESKELRRRELVIILTPNVL